MQVSVFGPLKYGRRISAAGALDSGATIISVGLEATSKFGLEKLQRCVENRDAGDEQIGPDGSDVKQEARE